ncbi:autotransporter domain-containing protein [Laribacter hongkongensis]|uniref:autotransporter domain-containing protein n=3 Tax=Laribacter hongkongensis TaxID=168471 RepID=UPI001EFE44F9|nr:autotransporter domain-containing protein [Laribacter hongkongensis]MCG8995175.1 autotransporter domain-containing protein [Laribacter hongkongensis]MCG9009857.1 autotransporter domain-containing protein [Laribacter hongkongensis]MCG9023722.1 autotransporter domain-containing protein [Laribacter hongkongensis]MCG9073609.1 autotransporter domain-containing protein [Laribacter hongkongensis]
MNKTHRIVWSTVRQAYVVAHEFATACGKPAATRVAAACAASLLGTTPVLADWIDLPSSTITTIVNAGDRVILPAGESIDVSDGPAVRITGIQNGVITSSFVNDGHIHASGAYTAIEIDSNTLGGFANHDHIAGSNGGVLFSGTNVLGVQNSGRVEGFTTHGIEFRHATLNTITEDSTVFINETGGHVSSANQSALDINTGSTAYGDIINQGNMGGGKHALSIRDSTVYGQILNEGTMLGATSSILISGSTITGPVADAAGNRVAIENSGLLQTGLIVDDSVINGTIINRGVIASDTPPNGGPGDSHAVSVQSGSSITGLVNEATGVINGGVAIAGAVGTAGLLNAGTINTQVEGLLYQDGAMAGSIRNTGTMTGFQASWDALHAKGIVVLNAQVAGGVQNAGLIAGVNSGIRLDNAQITGGLRNESGATITLASLRDDDDPSTRRGSAILVNGGQVSGGILNAGTLDASSGRSGIELANHAEVNGNVVNSGTIHASLGGVVVSDSTVNGLIDNQRTIQTGHLNNLYVSDINGVLITGASTLNGVTGADGNKLAIRNSGTITSNDGASLRISGIPDLAAPQPTSAGSMGSEMPPLTIHGNIVNEATGILDNSNGGQDAVAIEYAYIDGSLINNGKLLTRGTGINMNQSWITGNLVNNGEIQMDGGIAMTINNTWIDGQLANSGKITGSSESYGIQLENATLSQGFMNAATGEIKSLGDALDITDSSITGGILNAGRIESTDSDGMDTNHLILNGNLDNQGTILARDNGLELQDSVIRGSVLNSGTIVAGRDGIHLAWDGDPMTVSGDIRNSGRIEGSNGSAILLEHGTTVQGAIVNTATGRLFGNFAGIEVDGAVLAGGIDNAGLIAGNDYGIALADTTAGGIRITGAVRADSAAIILTGNTDAGGLTLQGQAGKPALLDSQGYAVLVVQPSPALRSRDEARLGGMTMAGHTGVHGDIYAPGERVTVTGKDNYLSGALDIRQLTVQAGGELVLDKLESTSARNTMRQAGMASDGLPFLTDALKTADGVQNSGRLALARPADYRITGNYAQSADATLAVRATGNTTYSKLKISNTATLASGTRIDVDVRQDSEIRAGASSSDTLFSRSRLPGVIQAAQLVSDGTFRVSDNSALFDFSAEKTGNNVDLVLQRAGGDSKSVYLEQIVSDQQSSVPLANRGAARALDQITDRLVNTGSAGEMAPVINALGRISTQSGLARAVEQLTPALHSAALSAVSDSLGAINRVVQARIEGNRGLSSGEELSGERYVWVKPFGSHARQEARSETAGFTANTGGMVFGADTAVHPRLRLGGAFAYAHSNVDGLSSSAPQSSKVDVYQLIGYGSVQLDDITEFNFQLDGGRNRNKGERQLPFMNTIASSDYDSTSYHAGAGLGRTFAFGSGMSNTPSVRLDYTRIKEDAYRETGAGAASLVNDARSVEQLLLAVDNRITLPLDERQSVALNFGAAFDLMNDGAQLTSAFAGEPGAVFSTRATDQSRWLWRAGLGYTHKADTGKGGLEITGRLDGEWRKGGYSNGTASVKARYAF